MDKPAVKAIVDREIDALLVKLGIPHWKLMISYQPQRAKDGWIQHGFCERKVQYNKATINLNPQAFDKSENALETLRHELFHVLLAPYDLVRFIVEEAVKCDPVKLAMIEEAWTFATEQAVINLERMYQGLTTHQAPAEPDE